MKIKRLSLKALFWILVLVPIPWVHYVAKRALLGKTVSEFSGQRIISTGCKLSPTGETISNDNDA